MRDDTVWWQRLIGCKEVQFFAMLPRASSRLAFAWWGMLLLRGALPALMATAMGDVVGAVQHGTSVRTSLLIVGITFVLLQSLPPMHQAISASLGDRAANRLHEQAMRACTYPAGITHFDSPEAATDLVVAKDFDRGITGPPFSATLDFIAGGLVLAASGLAYALVLCAYAWWPPMLLGGAWLATHWWLRESTVWRERTSPEARAEHRAADYAFRLAVEPAAAKELRLFNLETWMVDRFARHRVRLHAMRERATRLREQPMLWCALVVAVANATVFVAMAWQAAHGQLPLAELVTFTQAAIGMSAIAFGGLNWALDGAAESVAAVRRLEPVMRAHCQLGGVGTRRPVPRLRGEIRFRDVTFAYPGRPRVLDRFNLSIPASSSLAIVGENGAGKTTLVKLLCRLYEPQSGSIEVDGVDVRELDLDGWRARVAVVFQDFLRLELSVRDNVAPRGAPDAVIEHALRTAHVADVAALGTPLSAHYEGGTDLSGGQWQRIALARGLCALQLGADVLLLDEPTAQLDVTGEAEIFRDVLAATRQVTSVIISHRFSTVRHADRICVLEHGRVAELGSHEELMARDGRYRRMFELQAHRFVVAGEEA